MKNESKVALLSAYISIISLIMGIGASESSSRQNYLLVAQIDYSREYIDYVFIERHQDLKHDWPLLEFKRKLLDDHDQEIKRLILKNSNWQSCIQILSLCLIIAQLRLLEVVVLARVSTPRSIVYLTNTIFLISIISTAIMIGYLVNLRFGSVPQFP